MKLTDEQRQQRRKNVIIGHRKRMILCTRCGQDIHNGSLCKETYIKADMRNKEPTILVDQDRRIKTIISYRKRKNLCIRCGLELHPDSPCEENYEKSDKRQQDDKDKRPAIVETPKIKEDSLLDILSKNKNIEEKDLSNINKIKLQRSHITININFSPKGHRVEFSFLNYISRKYQNHIICCIGSFSKLFIVSELIKLRKLPNIIDISGNTPNMILSYIYGSTYFFSYECDYTSISVNLGVPTCMFKDTENLSKPFRNLPNI